MRYVVTDQVQWLTYGVVASTVLAVAAVLWMLTVKPHILHPCKRAGLALIGSGLLMSISNIDGGPTPFGQWTTILARLGVLILVVGYALDHHLLPQLRRLNEWQPRQRSQVATEKWNVLRQAAWAANKKERKEDPTRKDLDSD